MKLRLLGSCIVMSLFAAFTLPPVVFAEEEEEEASPSRQIEEITVTAERRESTVQDTAISITAFTDDFLEDFGIRNQEDLQNFIPATTIQPYDLSIRGIGRLFRALGGDPGVATYVNGTYSEDFGIVSTEGGLYDIERIEVLRGPQGTLYGRNGVGGAVNFHTRKPHDEFEGHLRTVLGNFQTQDLYGTLNVPLVKDTLLARFNATRRERNGVMNDLTPGNPHINDWGDTNYALSLQFTPTENVTMDLRVNDRDYKRMMSGAQGAGSILISENGGLGDEVTGGERLTSAMVHGYRPVDPSAGMCDAAIPAVPVGVNPIGFPVLSRTVRGAPSPNCVIRGRELFDFEWNGTTRFGQRLLPGVDPAGLMYNAATGGPNYAETYTTFGRPNYAYNWYNPLAAPANPNQLLDDGLLGNGVSVPSLTASELVTNTNGFNDEYFDHKAAYFNAEWVATDWLTVKYIGQYTDYFYSRVTDDDRTGNYFDQQFYAAQSNENYQHELQFFIDVGDSLQITSGVFWFGNDIKQQLDFYSPEGWSRYTAPAAYPDPTTLFGFLASSLATGTSTSSAFLDATLGQMTSFSARDYFQSGGPPVGIGAHPAIANPAAAVGGISLTGINPAPQFSDPSIKEAVLLYSLWYGDQGDSVTDGPATPGTTFIWDTTNETDAFAVYAQGEWQINETWALTLGVRLAEDDKKATEAVAGYFEIPLSPDLLYQFNRATGALRPDGSPTGREHIRFTGIPASRSLWRRMENDFEDVTWRVNIDFTPNDSTLTYFSVTTGYRAGGFNLGYYSAVPTYDAETLIAYELGYKGRLLDNTLQVNASVYYYDYEDIHLQSDGRSILGGMNVSVVNGPAAETRGIELEGLWLATDDITLGLTYSYTNSEYVEEYILQGAVGVVATTNPFAPTSLYTPQELLFPIEGRQLPRVPENKVAAWAEYTWSLGDLGNMALSGTFSWTDEFPAAGRPIGDLPIDTAPSFMRLDTRLSWTSADEAWTVTGFVNNVTDEIGIRNVFTYGEQEGFRRVVEPTLPRMAGIELEYRFGAFK